MQKTRRFMKRLGAMMVGIVGSIVISRAPGASATEVAPSNPTAAAIFTQMVAAMRRLPDPGPVTYDVSFEPHGLTIALIEHDEAVRPGLLFVSNVAPSILTVHEAGDGMEDVSDQTGKEFLGPPTFFAATWNEARSIATRAPEFESPAPIASPQAPHTPPSQTRPLPEDTTRREVIGDVATFSDRYYTLERLPDADGGIYHLRLHARSAPDDHPLTDVYVDPQTGLPVRLDARFRNDVVVSGYRGTMTLRFGSVDGRWMIVGGTIVAKAHVLLSHVAGTVDYRIGNVRFGAVSSAQSSAAPH
jgi:hypothetical protein